MKKPLTSKDHCDNLLFDSDDKLVASFPDPATAHEFKVAVNYHDALVEAVKSMVTLHEAKQILCKIEQEKADF